MLDAQEPGEGRPAPGLGSPDWARWLLRAAQKRIRMPPMISPRDRLRSWRHSGKTQIRSCFAGISGLDAAKVGEEGWGFEKFRSRGRSISSRASGPTRAGPCHPGGDCSEYALSPANPSSKALVFALHPITSCRISDMGDAHAAVAEHLLKHYGLVGKQCLVTGGTAGIGRAIVEELASLGARQAAHGMSLIVFGFIVMHAFAAFWITYAGQGPWATTSCAAAAQAGAVWGAAWSAAPKAKERLPVCRVVTCGRKADAVAELVEECKAKGFDVQGVAADVATADGRQAVITAATESFGGKLGEKPGGLEGGCMGP